MQITPQTHIIPFPVPHSPLHWLYRSIRTMRRRVHITGEVSQLNEIIIKIILHVIRFNLIIHSMATSTKWMQIHNHHRLLCRTLPDDLSILCSILRSPPPSSSFNVDSILMHHFLGLLVWCNSVNECQTLRKTKFIFIYRAIMCLCADAVAMTWHFVSF